MKRTFSTSLSELHLILEWIHSSIAAVCEPSLQRRIELASEEAIVNVIQYSGSEQIEITVKVFPKSHVEIAFKDHGPPFNPLEEAPPDLNAPIEERQVGGLGVHLIRQCMDEVRYQREGDSNLLTLVKKLPVLFKES